MSGLSNTVLWLLADITPKAVLVVAVIPIAALDLQARARGGEQEIVAPTLAPTPTPVPGVKNSEVVAGVEGEIRAAWSAQ